jgi:folate-binding protein YgfZ
MTTIPYQINSRQLTVFTPLPDELVYESDKNYLFDLTYLTGLQVTGDRAQEFLQGQLSCDVRNVNNQEMQQGAMCDLKGRILALLDVVNWGEHGFQLILPNDLLQSTKASLAKTAMFSRVTLNPITNYQVFGFYLQNTNDIVPLSAPLSNVRYSAVFNEHYYCYCLGDNSFIFLIEHTQATIVREQFATCLQTRGSLAWHALQLQQKRIEIYPESKGLFLPHRLGLQLSGYLSFDKGCYKGQEIIARTHYRAKLKHELKIFKIYTEEALLVGKKIFNDNNIEIGELIDFCPTNHNEYLIAVSIVFDYPQSVFIEGQNTMVRLL